MRWRHAHDSTKENPQPGKFDLFGSYDVVDTEIVGSAEKDGKVIYSVEVRPLVGQTTKRWAADLTTVYFPVSDFVSLEDKSGRPIDDPLVPVLKYPLKPGAEWSVRVAGFVPPPVFSDKPRVSGCELTFSISFKAGESQMLTVLGQKRSAIPVQRVVTVDAEASFQNWKKANPTKTEKDFFEQAGDDLLLPGAVDLFGTKDATTTTTWYVEGVGPVKSYRPAGFLSNPYRVDLREFSDNK